ncbi:MULTISPECIES: hypothetical protein [Bartonella]|nr:hypothetical protein [Bartonella grahamii]
METVILSTLSNLVPVYIGLGKHAVMNIHKNALKIDISKTSV